MSKKYILAKIVLVAIAVVGMAWSFHAFNKFVEGDTNWLNELVNGVSMLLVSICLTSIMVDIERHKENLVVTKKAYDKTLTELMEVEKEQIRAMENKKSINTKNDVAAIVADPIKEEIKPRKINSAIEHLALND